MGSRCVALLDADELVIHNLAILIKLLLLDSLVNFVLTVVEVLRVLRANHISRVPDQRLGHSSVLTLVHSRLMR